jgi:hypothetical protein
VFVTRPLERGDQVAIARGSRTTEVVATAHVGVTGTARLLSQQSPRSPLRCTVIKWRLPCRCDTGTDTRRQAVSDPADRALGQDSV